MKYHLKPLVGLLVNRHFSAGSMILYQGEVPRAACILIRGVVKVYSISAKGEEHIILFNVAGDIFPTPWIFGKTSGTIFFYEALTDCTVAYVQRKQLLDYMHKNTERLSTLLDYISTNYSASLMRINALEQPKAFDKLVFTLYFLCKRYGKSKLNKNKSTIPIALTHQTLASLVGLTRETTAMEMSKLKKRKIISYKKQQYTVNIPKLQEVMGEDILSEVSISN